VSSSRAAYRAIRPQAAPVRGRDDVECLRVGSPATASPTNSLVLHAFATALSRKKSGKKAAQKFEDTLSRIEASTNGIASSNGGYRR